jgi:hypothetical protein
MKGVRHETFFRAGEMRQDLDAPLLAAHARACWPVCRFITAARQLAAQLIATLYAACGGKAHEVCAGFDASAASSFNTAVGGIAFTRLKQ